MKIELKRRQTTTTINYKKKRNCSNLTYNFFLLAILSAIIVNVYANEHHDTDISKSDDNAVDSEFSLDQLSVESEEDQKSEEDLSIDENVKEEKVKEEEKEENSIESSIKEMSVDEQQKEKIKAFYKFIETSLNHDQTLRKYSRRVECIIEELKEQNAMKIIDESQYEFKRVVNSTKYEIIVNDRQHVMSELEPLITSANTGCFLPGIFAVVVLAFIMGVVILITFRMHRGDD